MILRSDGMLIYYHKKSKMQNTWCQHKPFTRKKPYITSVLSCVDYHYVSVMLMMSTLNEPKGFALEI